MAERSKKVFLSHNPQIIVGFSCHDDDMTTFDINTKAALSTFLYGGQIVSHCRQPQRGDGTPQTF